MKLGAVRVCLPLFLLCSTPGFAQISRLEFAERPRLVDCADRPCFRIWLNPLSEEGDAVALASSSEEFRSRIEATVTVSRSGRESGQLGGTVRPFSAVFMTEERTSTVQRKALLLFDLSGSMNGPLPGVGKTKFEAAKEAARAFIESLSAAGVSLAIVPFESHDVAARIQQASFESDPASTLARLEALPVPENRNNTALYSAIHEALAVLENESRAGSQVSLVVLTDGRNDVRPAPADDPDLLEGQEGFAVVRERADSVGMQINTIGFGEGSRSFDEETLQALAWPTPASYYYADNLPRLLEAFQAARERLVNRVRMTLGPVGANRLALTGADVAIRLTYSPPEGDAIITPDGFWSAPALGSPAFEDSLSEEESSDFDRMALAGDARSRWTTRLAVLVFYSVLLAAMAFVLPRFLWAARAR